MAASSRPHSAQITQNLEKINRSLAEKIDDLLKNDPKEKYEIIDNFIKFTKYVEEIKKIIESNSEESSP
ncbi:MAG: hypothetical protein LBJ71_02915 [Holosporaceae bacterium]|nr:hypothetical protein [Holosporaceae bacterium]